ncbi:MAG: DUF2341 domain-containing protein, partial [Verrucomicrobiota bacterium]
MLNESLTNFSYFNFATFDGSDLRVFAEDDTTPLNYELEKWDIAGNSYLWVQVPSLTNNACIYLHWGDTNNITAPAYTTNGATWSQDYVGVWHMGDDRGSGIHLDSAADNDATEVDDPVTTPNGQIGDAQTFDGGADEMIIANESNFDQTTALSVSAWFTVDAFDTSWQALIAKGEGNEWRLHRNNNGNTLRMSANGAISATSAIDDGQWHHIQINKSTVSGMEIYIDGVLENSDTNLTGAIGLNNEPVRIGENPDSQNREWEGDIDEVRIMDMTRSSNWVWAAYQNSGQHNTFNCYDPVEVIGTSNTADLVVTKSVNTNNLLIGTNLTYTISVTNLGPNPAVGLVVTDSLPAEATFVSSVPPQDSINGNDIVYNLGPL